MSVRTLCIAALAGGLLLGSCQIASAHRHRHREDGDGPVRAVLPYPIVWVVPDTTYYGNVRTHLHRYRRFSDFPFYGFTIYSPAGSYPVYRYYRDYVPYESWYPPMQDRSLPPSGDGLWDRRLQQDGQLGGRGMRFLDRLDERRARFFEPYPR
jgi:hypothetical protein